MQHVEQCIATVEGLYRQLTGSEPRSDASAAHAPIPPEVDAEAYVNEKLQRLYQTLQSQSLQPQSLQGGACQPIAVRPPRVNVLENETEWLCEVEMPGVDKSNLSVQLRQGLLHIAATRSTRRANDHRAVCIESQPGARFERTIPLPPFIRGESTEAKIENGLLTVHLKKDAAAMQNDMTIKVA